MSLIKPKNPQQEAKVLNPILEPKKRGRKRKNKRYFTKITELAISAYNNLGDEPADIRKKNKIYERFINYPFYKLAEFVYNTKRYGYIPLSPEDIKHELIAYMIDRIHMYKPDKGAAFSYFNRMVKNWLIAENQKAYAMVKVTTDVVKMDTSRNILAEESQLDILTDQQEFFDLFIDYADLHLSTLFNSRRDIMIADSLLEVFRHRKNIENFNKKAIYLLVRERSRCEQQYVTKVVNILKELYEEMFAHFQKTGKVESSRINNFF